MLSDRVRVYGVKADDRARDVPLVDYPIRPEFKRTGFNTAIRRYNVRTGQKINPYQARKSFARWMEDAHVPRARRVASLGHSMGAGDVQDRYERHEIDGYLREDAERMRAALGPQKLSISQGGAA